MNKTIANNQKFDIYPRIYGKMTTLNEAMILVHCFRLTLNQLTLKRIKKKDEHTLIIPGAIFCFVEDIGNIIRWTDNRKWSYSKISSPFLDYDELDGNLIKRTITLGLGQHKYHLINYFNKSQSEIKSISNNNIIKALAIALQRNKCLLSDSFLTYNNIGIDFLYGKKCVNTENLSKIQGNISPMELYVFNLKRFLKYFNINISTLTIKDLNNRELIAVEMLLKLSQDVIKFKK